MSSLQSFQTSLQNDFIAFARKTMEDNKATVMLYHATNDTVGQNLNGHLTQINLPESLGLEKKIATTEGVTAALNTELVGIIADILATSEDKNAERFTLGLAFTPASITCDGMYGKERFQFAMALEIPKPATPTEAAAPAPSAPSA